MFVSYHHGGDQYYYNEFSRQFHDQYEAVTDNSLDRRIDSENIDYVMRRIRENYITGTSCTIVLVGNESWGRKYIDWEIKTTLDKQHGLIGVQLPKLKSNLYGRVKVPDRLSDNIDSEYAVWVTWANFTSSLSSCRSYIEQANSRSKSLIKNTRDRRLRNA
ncbi:TIR domain-containing protein [Xenorhabdus bovienii]|uniref:TIR domain-containing protein n=1 Tax=Xenorhabdus bovienii TaxID=40576 RepID=UPI0023B2815A|nr:TIR domain-containing protein [Xenorhabdus bovienii]